MYKNGIYGAVIGDICGSKLEVDEIRNRKTGCGGASSVLLPKEPSPQVLCAQHSAI